MNTQHQINQIASQFAHSTPMAILEKAFELYEKIAISFSGAEDVVLIHMACAIQAKQIELGQLNQADQKVAVFSLDTGRLHPETYRFIEDIRQQYAIELDVLAPDADDVEDLVKEKGLFSFYQDGHEECCSIRKVAPLRRHLRGLDAWITGQRRDQSPATRNEVPVAQIDLAFSNANKSLVKFNPLANWTSAQVWQYIGDHEVPYNSLHKQGFKSIGCQPCTRAISPFEHERLGRWWWEEATQKECGLHVVKSES